MPSAAATAGEVDSLKDQIQALQDRLDRVEQDQAAIDERTQEVAPAALLVTGGDIPGSFKLPGSDTSMSISGWLRADFQYDFDTNSDALGDGSFYFSTIPLDGTAAARKDGEFRFTSRQTSIDITTSTPTEFGEVSTFVSVRFWPVTGGRASEFTNNAHIGQLLESYGTIGPILVGKTYSTFSDYSSYPTTLDFFGPVGETWIYQTMIRYTHDVGNGMVLKLALENPETKAMGTPLVPGGTAVLTGSRTTIGGTTATSTLTYISDGGGLDGPDSLPDAVIKLEYDDSWGHLGLGGVFRNLEIDNGAGAQDSAFGWGLMAGLWAPTFGDDSLNASFIYGEGIGRYVFGGINDALVTSLVAGLTPKIEPIATWGFHVGYNHWWTDSLASNVVFGWVHNDIDVIKAFGPGNRGVAQWGTDENIQSIHANILWYPADPVMIGLEYIRGMRDTIAGDYATANRVQMAFWYSF
jgi:hypothetical protein